jgi:hypothetical protein
MATKKVIRESEPQKENIFLFVPNIIGEKKQNY